MTPGTIPIRTAPPHDFWHTSAVFASLYSALPDPLFVTDQHQNIQLINPGGCTLLGYEAQALLGQPMRCILAQPAEDWQRVRQLLTASAPPTALEIQFRRRDGQLVSTNVNVNTMCDGTGQEVGALFVLRPSPLHHNTVGPMEQVLHSSNHVIPEARAATNAELLQHLLDLTPSQIHVRDRAGNFILANHHSALALERHEDDLAGLTAAFRTNSPAAERASQAQDQLVLASAQMVQGEHEAKAADGTLGYYEWAKVPITWVGGERHVLTIMTDITERKRAQLLVEQRVAERTRQLDLRRRVTEGLSEMVVTMLNSHRPLSELFDFALAQVNQLLHADASALFTLEAAGERFALSAYQGILPTYIPHAERRLNSAPAIREKIGRRQPIFAPGPGLAADLVTAVNDQSTQFMLLNGQPLLQGSSYRAMALVPLVVHEELYGILALYFVQLDDAVAEELDLACNFGLQLALAIENTLLQNQIELTAAYSERARIGRDLHDSVTQTLFAASMLADLMPQIWDADPVKGKEKLAELRRITRGALAEMRILLVELRPSVLEDGDLRRLLQQLVEALVGRTPTQANLEIAGEVDTLPPEVRVVFYRTTQEALNNVIKHADAEQVTIRLHSTDGAVELTICDDGSGIEYDHVSGDHFGLSNMRERAAEIGGKLLFNSYPGGGTEVRLYWQPQLLTPLCPHNPTDPTMG